VAHSPADSGGFEGRRVRRQTNLGRGAALADERRRGGAPRSLADGGSKGVVRSPAGDDIKGRTGRVEGGGR
jgi:hypothetical protein